MEELLKNFPAQFDFQPSVENSPALPSQTSGDLFYVIVGGMGGSHLSADFVKAVGGFDNIFVHVDYGLPNLPPEILSRAFFVAVSYSGNTEETLDFASQVLKSSWPLTAITAGGRLLSLADSEKIPYVKIPSGTPPRIAVGFMIVALLKLLGREDILEGFRAAAAPAAAALPENPGQALALAIAEKTPVFYSSKRNQAIAHYFKIMMNESAKAPAFDNYFPELNHNEMAGFDSAGSFKKFYPIFLKDQDDDQRIWQRLAATEKIFSAADAQTISIEITGQTRFEKIIRQILLANWMAYEIARSRGVDPAAVLTIEELKKLLGKERL